LFATILIAASLFNPSQSYARPEITVMDPVAERGERQVSIQEVRNNIESQYESGDDAAVTRAEEHEDSRREEIDASNLDSDAQRDIGCLTEAIFFESLHEPEEGQIAVANVIMNRAAWNEKDRPPNAKHRIEFSGSICDVVAFHVKKSFKQKRGHGRHAKWVQRTITTCAFSYRCERGFRVKLERFQKREEWTEIKTLATNTYVEYNSGNNEDPSEGATFYHATWMHKYPWWAKAYERTAKIGLHQFYKIK